MKSNFKNFSKETPKGKYIGSNKNEYKKSKNRCNSHRSLSSHQNSFNGMLKLEKDYNSRNQNMAK